ncbi:universal stress protein [Motilibacter aurantiacus]|uniref:universal stress protein n=1 Tax=Motilibacter aurantiacus TaxID=2714955 RepID=UPI0014095AB5|nr:universal stress protein [Motilibacter aurantiacus]NHC46500.1 universal stress protein [Motilibacter aurantiacus]
MSHQHGTVVVGVDFSHESERAAEWAAALADRRGIGLHLLHAEPVRQVLSAAAAWALPADDLRRLEDAATTGLARLAARLTAAHPPLPVTTRVCDGYPVDALLQAGRDGTVLVVGSTGRSALARVLVGSVGQHVAQQARCPVVVVRGRGVVRRGPVVVGVDGSPSAEEAVAFAVEEAALRRVPLRVVQAWQPHEAYQYGAWAVVGPSAQDLEQAARTSLEQALTGWQEKHPEVEVERVVQAGHPAEALLTAASCAQLLVVGSHGRHGLSRVLLGSVSAAAVQHADCPVAVVRPVREAAPSRPPGSP